MKHIIFIFLKPLSFLPALAMMYVIYGFSAQDAGTSGNLSRVVSVKIVEVGNDILNKGLDEMQIEQYAYQIEHPVRKLAHMTEYFMLAVTVSFPFYVYGLRSFPLMLVAGIICDAFAAGDEHHQSFVAGRGPSVKDVGIDSIEIFLGILTVQIICWIFLTPAHFARRQEEFAYRKRARRQEAMRRRRNQHTRY